MIDPSIKVQFYTTNQILPNKNELEKKFMYFMRPQFNKVKNQCQDKLQKLHKYIKNEKKILDQSSN